MEIKIPEGNVGVIIGRFQTPTLTDGHIDLVNYVIGRHKKVIILVGSTPGVMVTRRNPLDFFTRKLMIEETYNNVTVLPLNDMPSDKDWSTSVDERIIETCGDHDSVVLYGSRDAFIPYYSGKYPTVELEPSYNVSATEARSLASNDVRAHAEFRRGVVYAAHNRHPVTFPTVDIAVIKYSDVIRVATHIALGRKKNDPAGQWRFPGGFVDPRRDDSLEAAAKRETREELGQIEVHNCTYIGSLFIDDWRYRDEVDGIMTSIFVSRYVYGPLQAGDDLYEVRWFDIKALSVGKVSLVEQHKPILDRVLAYLEKKQQQ